MNYVLITELNGAPIKWFLEVLKVRRISLTIFILKDTNLDASLKSRFKEAGCDILQLRNKRDLIHIDRQSVCFCLDFRSLFIASLLFRGRIVYSIQGFESAFVLHRKIYSGLISFLRRITIRVPSSALKQKVRSAMFFSGSTECYIFPISPPQLDTISYVEDRSFSEIGVIANFYSPVKGGDFVLKLALESKTISKIHIFGDAELLVKSINARSDDEISRINRVLVLHGVCNHSEIFAVQFGIGFVPSISEGFGRAACEHMAHSRILVSTLNGGINDIYSELEGNKFLLDYDDTKTFDDHISYIQSANHDELVAILDNQNNALMKKILEFRDAPYGDLFVT